MVGIAGWRKEIKPSKCGRVRSLFGMSARRPQSPRDNKVESDNKLPITTEQMLSYPTRKRTNAELSDTKKNKC